MLAKLARRILRLLDKLRYSGHPRNPLGRGLATRPGAEHDGIRHIPRKMADTSVLEGGNRASKGVKNFLA